MTVARRQQISLSDTPYYHCVSRCVRRAFLCGRDHATGEDFDHRREWVVERLAQLVEVFAVDLCAYAIMSNHYHVVLRVDAARADAWGDREVVERWLRAYRGPEVARRYLAGGVLDVAEKARIEALATDWRQRLTSISWFMRALNEHIARRANREDECKGHFWEGRFKSQALLDERAVLACMAYVDLNPVRAGIAATPEDSDYTSARQRAREVRESPALSGKDSGCVRPTLAPMIQASNVDADWANTVCEVRLLDYLQLLDDTGRAVRAGKRGAISGQSASVLERLRVSEEAWLRHMRPRPNPFFQAIGAAEAMQRFARSIGRRWLWGCRRYEWLCGGVD